MSLKRPTGLLLSWTATSLTTAFGSYRIYRRPARTPVVSWKRVGLISVPTGYTAATVEAQHTSWVDWEAGWIASGVNGGRWDAGWDYAITVRNAALGVESVIATASTSTRNTVADAGDSWVTCNAAPWLNTPLSYARTLDGEDEATLRVFQPAGADRPKTRTRDEVPARTWQVGWRTGPFGSIDDARMARAVALSGRQVAVLTPQGDRVLGVLGPISSDHPAGETVTEWNADLVETGDASAVADYNLPAVAVSVAATPSYINTPYNASYNPLTSAFSFFYAGVLADEIAGFMGCISGGSTRYYGFSGSGGAGVVNYAFGGAGATSTANAAITYDTRQHALVATDTGTAQVLYYDGASVATASSAHGSIDITAGGNGSMSAGALSAGVNASNVKSRAWGYYARALTATEAANLSYYLLGYPGYRPPAGAVIFIDLADDRCWDGISTTAVDLTGNTDLNATLINSPATRGIPWPLRDLDRA